MLTTLPGLTWPPSLLFILLSVLSQPLQLFFYHSELSAAFHMFSSLAVYLTAWLNAVVMVVTPFRSQLQEIGESPAYKYLNSTTRLLLKGYLHGYFLLSNFLGPIYFCWLSNADNPYLDNLAHLYGFTVGTLHAPLMVTLRLRVIVPLTFGCLGKVVVEMSRVVYFASFYIPGIAEKVHIFLKRLHVVLLELPEEIMKRINRGVLGSERLFLKTVVYSLAAMEIFILYDMVTHLYRPYPQRLAMRLLLKVLMFVGDGMFGVGLWVEGYDERKGPWEGGGSLETIGI